MSDNVAIEKYDLLIIGGGPSGSTAAHWAAKLNLKAIIIDAKSFPRDKICGDGLPAMTVELLTEIGLNLHDLPSAQVQKVDSIDINTPSNAFHLDSTKTTVFNLARKQFDNYLWSTIPKSIAKHEEHRPVKISYDFFKASYRIEIKGAHSTKVFSATYIIGADGANSWVRKKTGFFPDFDMEHTIAKRAYADVEKEKNFCELNYISNSFLTYVWQFSLPNGKINTGVYFSPTQHNAERENGKECIQSISAKIDWSTYSAFPIPTFQPSVSVFSRKGIFLVGDAAGFSDPIFGHGIDIGMLSGKIAFNLL